MVLATQWCQTLCLWLHGLQPARLLCPWNSPGKNTLVGHHSLLQGIFPTQESNPGLPHCRQILFFFFNLFFYWRIIALQNFVVFCQASTWISHRYTYIPSLLNLPPLPTPSHLLGWYRAPVWVSWDMQQIPGGHLFHIWWCKLPCFSFHTSHPLLPSPPSVSLFSMSVSPLLPCK